MASETSDRHAQLDSPNQRSVPASSASLVHKVRSASAKSGTSCRPSETPERQQVEKRFEQQSKSQDEERRKKNKFWGQRSSTNFAILSEAEQIQAEDCKKRVHGLTLLGYLVNGYRGSSMNRRRIPSHCE